MKTATENSYIDKYAIAGWHNESFHFVCIVMSWKQIIC